jgi:hypothetical protein
VFDDEWSVKKWVLVDTGISMLGALLCFVALFLAAFVVFMWGLAGYLLGYYRRGGEILRGDEARNQSLKVVVAGFLLMVLVALASSILLRN